MRLSCGGSSVYPEGVAGDFLQVPRDLEAGQVGKEGSSSHYNTKLRCHRSCSSSRLGLLNTDGLKHFPYSQYVVQR